MQVLTSRIVPFGNYACKVLESESHAELDLASPRSLICTPYFADGLAKGSRIRGKIAGLAKLNPVEQVVDLCAEIQTEAFGNRSCLLQHEIPIVGSRTTKVVATQISTQTERSILKKGSSWQS